MLEKLGKENNARLKVGLDEKRKNVQITAYSFQPDSFKSDDGKFVSSDLFNGKGTTDPKPLENITVHDINRAAIKAIGSLKENLPIFREHKNLAQVRVANPNAYQELRKLYLFG